MSASHADDPLTGMSEFGQTRSDLSGSAGNVVQSRDILGGIHFHQTSAVSVVSGPVPRQLPWDVRGFVGRADALARLDTLHIGHRDHPLSAGLVMVTGTAGVGKTSLVVHWAHQVGPEFPDGQLYVNLRGYDPAAPLAPIDALARFLRAFGVSDADLPTGLEDRAERYRSLVAGRRMLIVLDNAATVGQVRPLLPGAGGCLVLVTSRNMLSGLAARDGARRLSLDLLTERQAIELVRATLADYRPVDSDTDIALLARLCARLPLALRIAAERAAARPAMPLTDLIENLRGESSLWEALSLQDEEEADAVRSVFAWSYRTLPPAAARLFRLLGVHPGLDISLPTAAALAGEPATRMHGLLDLLCGAYLLEQTGPNRYQFHDLLRAYAADQAEQQPDEAHLARDRMLSWYLHSAAAASHQTLFPYDPPVPLLPGVTPLEFSSRAEAIAWYEAERANLCAVATTAATAGLDRFAWQLAAALDGMHGMCNPRDEWLLLGQTGLAAARRLGERHAEGLMLTTLGIAHTYNEPRQYDHAAGYLNQALTLLREAGDHFNQIRVTNVLGVMYLRARRLPQAATYLAQTQTLARAHGDWLWEAAATGNLGEVHLLEGDFATAIDKLHHALRGLRAATPDPSPQIGYLILLADAHRELDQLTLAAEYLAEAASQFDMAARGDQAWALLEQGRLHHAFGRFEQAAAAYQQAAALYRALNEQPRGAWVLDAVGELYHATGQPEQAADFHRRAVAVFADYDRPFDQAVALDHLATALASTGEHHTARQHWTQALALLEPFDDRRATTIRERIHTTISQPASQTPQPQPHPPGPCQPREEETHDR